MARSIKTKIKIAKPKKTWTLIKYFKYQTDKSQRQGKMIMRSNTPNGFIEKIFELGFNEYVYTIQSEEKGDISYSVQIGQYLDDKAENEMNKKVADASLNLLPLLELIQQKRDSKHLEDIYHFELNRLTTDENCDEKPSMSQFVDYCRSLIPRGRGVNNKAIKDLFVYFNENKNWKINGRPMKDWRVEVKRKFLNLMK